jgi:regulator of sirC expression with transglutaminase-like and TPR domain
LARLIVLNPVALFERRDRGLALILLGQNERALVDLKRYLEEVPNAADTLDVKHRLANLQTD